MLDVVELLSVWPPTGEDGFDAIFVTASGEQRRVPWSRLPLVVEEIGGSVRWSRSVRGQGYPGWYWSATLGRRIGFESWVARDHLVALDFDPEVVDITAQQFWLVWCDGQGEQCVMRRISCCGSPAGARGCSIRVRGGGVTGQRVSARGYLSLRRSRACRMRSFNSA